jgi:hypothetical protein
MSKALRAAAALAALAAAPLAVDLRLRRSEQPLSAAWQDLPVARRGDTLLGLSLRPRQMAALGLDPLRTAAEPWEAVTTPPDPQQAAMASCLPEHLIANHNQWLVPGGAGAANLFAYLFWGAEYWIKRRDSGDGRYLAAVERIVSHA